MIKRQALRPLIGLRLCLRCPLDWRPPLIN
ncbi:hypothetical protein DFO67_11043 [Modicisalibacter xianhensis]|uniref:Uncharacterized protein n=1 Tax=Modicisalibacter xianhensis TaxID=442341 RepID=A0A4R8FXQ4_9GAMM|nr:hypothetical protein DFO67_11043 [Halomonas xianhensis]